jgi:hypothetical protein
MPLGTLNSGPERMVTPVTVLAFNMLYRFSRVWIFLPVDKRNAFSSRTSSVLPGTTSI